MKFRKSLHSNNINNKISKLKTSNFLNNKRRSSVIHLQNEVQYIIENKEKEKELKELSPKELDEIFKKSAEKSKVGKIKNFMKYIDVLIAICVAANIFFSLVENELFYSYTKKYLKNYFENKTNKEITREVYKKCELRKISKEEDSMRKINLLIVCVILILNFFHYYLTLYLWEEEGLISEDDGFFSTGLWKFFILESIILGIFDPPGLNYFFTGTTEHNVFAFSLGGLICIETIFKSYVIFRVYSYFSLYMTESANSICNNSDANSGVHFALKCELKSRPFTMLLFIFTCFIIGFGFSLRTFEYFLVPKGFIYGSFEINDQDYLKDLINSIWLTIVTMTTVGYGDFFPGENYGRIIVILAYLVGALLVSMTVVSLAIISEFSEKENRAYSIIKKLKANNNALYKAADVISSLCLLRLRIMKRDCKLSEKFLFVIKLKKSISDFKDNFKVASSISLPFAHNLIIMHKDINDKYDSLLESISPLKEITLYMDYIWKSQKNSNKKLKKILNRQEKLGKYLVDKNNEMVKRTLYELSSSSLNILKK